MDAITLSHAIDGYLLYAAGRQLSENTLRDYCTTFRRFREFLPDDPPMEQISLGTIEAFFAGLNGLSRKTALNYHTGLSALWTWAVGRGVATEHVLHQFTRPKPNQNVIEIFTEEQVQRLLDACKRTPAYSRPGKARCSNARPTALRDKAIILTLLDSMVRASELSGMRRSDMSLKEGRIKVLGKGAKERWVPISSETAGAIWQYLAARPQAKPQYDDMVFLTQRLRPMDRQAVLKVLDRLGQRVEVPTHPHKFRHTGATMFLRNGGNVFALKEILGHSTMTMVQRYVHLAEVDIQEAHRRASPVYNWDLRV